ncbi:MAG: hypothetical protein L0Y32_00210 [Nevskiales bacterium]|nr:hypothetical protein [Nevskiales bacterium]
MINPRTKLILLAVLFAAPLAAAGLLFFVYPDWQPQEHSNYGTLISPARPFPELKLVDVQQTPFTELKGKWTLVHLGAEVCEDACVARVRLTRQVRLALGQNRRRVQRLYLARDPAVLAVAHRQLAAEHPDLLFAAEAGEPGPRAADFFQAGAPADSSAIYLLDPLGHWLMVYHGDAQPKGVHADLKKLLRFSRLG